MDNKKQQQQNFSRPNTASKASQSSDSNRKTSDTQVNKSFPRNSRRREQNSVPRNDQQQRSSKQQQTTKLRPNVDKRPRQRGSLGNPYGVNYNPDGACASDDFSIAGAGLAADKSINSAAKGAISRNEHFEINSVYAQGSKKQNLNHLLNFNYTPLESDYYEKRGVFRRGRVACVTFTGSGDGDSDGSYPRATTRAHQLNMHNNKKCKFNKEQFLQANFQFVIKSCAKPSFNASPDALIDWNMIEQINIQTTEDPKCPICLYPPVAAKLTRCGHVFCWPCVLHYLALTDKCWRKCPICYEAIHINDLKSTVILQQNQKNVGEVINLQLMRRKKGSMFIEKYTTNAESVERYPRFSKNDEGTPFSKFLIANRYDILDIIEREHRELTTNKDAACPEVVFIQKALDLLQEKRMKLGDLIVKQDKNTENEELIYDESKNMLTEKVTNILEEKSENVDTVIMTEVVTDFEEPACVIMPETNEHNTEENISESVEDEASNPILQRVDSPTLDVSATACYEFPPSPTATKYYYFYQSIDGQNIYLHPMNIKMLQACYGTLDKAPQTISASILQKEHLSMDEEYRRKFTCLRHLPLTCQFAMVEVELKPPTVTKAIMQLFKHDIINRKKERERREHEENKREIKINEFNDRQLGKLIDSTADLNIDSQDDFPNWDFPDMGYIVNLPEIPKHKKSDSLSVWDGANKTLSSWGKPKPPPIDEFDEMPLRGVTVHHLNTRLGDVLAEAMAQQVPSGSRQNGSNKKKKAKKMLPLFSTGINYNGN